MKSLAGIIITLNEEQHIERCLASLKFCDEIIIVDSGSSDRTLEIARKITAKIFSHPWEGYSAQRNFALQLTQCRWVLSIDADEEASSDLAAEIDRVFCLPDKYLAFTVPRKTFHSGRWIKHGGWYPNRLVRLFKKGEGRWVGNELHERWLSPGPVGKLEGHLYHYSFSSITDQVDRNNRYSSLGAVALSKKGERFSLLKLLGKPIFKFIETYVVKLGFLDGRRGFMIAVSAAYSVFLKWAKLWEIQGRRRVSV